MRWVNFKRRGEIVHQSIMHDVICNLRIHLERYQAWYLSRGASIWGHLEETPYGALQEQSESEGGSEQSESEDEVIYDNVIDEVTDDEFEI